MVPHQLRPFWSELQCEKDVREAGSAAGSRQLTTSDRACHAFLGHKVWGDFLVPCMACEVGEPMTLEVLDQRYGRHVRVEGL